MVRYKTIEERFKETMVFVEDGHLMGYKRKGSDEEFKEFL
jgi:hypothetical protein